MSYQPRVSSARYTAEPVPKRYRGSQGWRCACAIPKYKRHADPPQCVSPEEINLWRAHDPERTTGEKAARVLIWLATEFSRKEETP